MDLTREKVSGYLERFPGVLITVIGDIMLDRYYWGEVERISPEAPVPVVKVTRKSSRLGGGANVAANLRDLGVGVRLLAVVGEDHVSEELENMLVVKGLGGEYIKRIKGRITTEKIRIVAQSQQVVRADFEDNEAVPDWCSSYFEETLMEGAQSSDALIISDYGKGVIKEELLRKAVESWRSKGKPVFVDPFINHFLWYKDAYIITPNAKEARSFYGSSLDGTANIENIGFKIKQALSLDALLITRGEEGMSLFTGENNHTHFPTVAEEVYDVTGAGDTVISVLTAARASGADLEEAVIMANRAAGEVVKEIGTTTLTREILLKAFD